MPAPGIIVGQNLLGPPSRPDEPQGRFFSSFSGATPKYAMNIGPRRSEFVETMARLSLVMPASRVASMLRNLPAPVAAAARTLLVRTADASGAYGYFDFLLSNVQLAQQEREQAVDTLTDNTVIFYSGQSAPTMQCSGTFLNTYQNDQNVWFQLIYHHLLRGSALARNGLICHLRYDSFYTAGYLTSLTTSTDAGAKDYVTFGFGFRVKQINIATPIVFSPSEGTSLIVNNYFAREQPPGADDTTRTGLETAAEPAAPLSRPAATPATVDNDRAIAPGATPREQQAAQDAEVEAQQAVVAESPALELPPASEGTTGDVQAYFTEETKAQVQTFDTALAPPTPASTPARQREAEAILSAATARGTLLVSPGTGSTARSGVVPRGVVAAQPAAATAAAREAALVAGSRSAPVRDAESQELADVYGAPPELLRQIQLAKTPTAKRSRQRPGLPAT